MQHRSNMHILHVCVMREQTSSLRQGAVVPNYVARPPTFIGITDEIGPVGFASIHDKA